MTKNAAPRSTPSCALFALSALLAAGPVAVAEAQTFSVGGGASVVNDTGAVSAIRGFDAVAGHLFAEMLLEPIGTTVGFQLRGSLFSLPPSAEGGPNIKTEAVTASVEYLFQEEWFRAGFIGGIGVYHLTPRSLETGQVSTDPSETVFGWSGGLVSTFEVTKRLELRLEATAALLRSEVEHRPLFLTLGFGYRF